MKLLLTSAGIKNASIHGALLELLDKPIAGANALCIPTAGYGHPMGTPGGAWRFVTRNARTPMCTWVEILGHPGADRIAQHLQGALGALGSADRRPAGQRRRCPLADERHRAFEPVRA
jgi:hypothetical protein